MILNINKFEDWLINKNLSRVTIESYLYYFVAFSIHKSFTQININDFLSKKQHKNGVARAFLRNLRKYLMTNYKECGMNSEERIEVAEIEIPTITGRRKERLIKPLTEEQVLDLEKQFQDEKEKLQLLMSYYGGLRIGELYKIQVGSFNWSEWKKNIQHVGECRVYGKGNKEGLAFFPSWLMKRIAKYIRTQSFPSLSSYLFLKDIESIEGIKIEHRYTTWEKKLKKAGIQAGITHLNSQGNIIQETKVHPHKLRHSWGHYLKNVKKVDIRNIQEILRHSSISSTQRYTYTDKSHLKEILNNFY